MKLSGPQRSLLKELSEAPRYVAESYAPFRKLKELGFVAEREGRFSSVAYVTDAGREAFKAADQS